MSRVSSAKKSKQKEDVLGSDQALYQSKQNSRQSSAKKSKNKNNEIDGLYQEETADIPKSSLKKLNKQERLEIQAQDEDKFEEDNINDQNGEKGDDDDDYQFVANPNEDLIAREEDEELGELDKLLKQTKEEKIKKIQEFNAQQEKKGITFKIILNYIGVVYLSRIPPYMKAAQIRNHFQRYGVLRVYLAPEGELVL